MKKLVAIIAMLFVNSSIAAEGDTILNSIVAVVNDGVVLASDLDAETNYLKLQSETSGQTLPSDDILKERVIERLIDQEVQRQHASKLGISVDPGSVNRAIEQIAGNNNMDINQFRQSMKDQGFNYERFRRNVEQELLLNRLIQRDVQSRIKVSAQEIDDFIDSNNDAENQRYLIQHILVAVPPTANAGEYREAQSKAEGIVAKLREGADFSQTAIANSDGARALEGGDLGWRSLQEVPDFLADVLGSMQINDISDPQRSANGLHIIRLKNKRSGAQTQQAETLVRHIYINSGETSDPETQIAVIANRIKAGESFEALAKEFSEDPNSASKGGELPWFSAGQMPAEIEEMAASLKTGVVSEPFRTQFGWHVLEVLDRRTSALNEDKLRQRAEQAIRQKKSEQETQRWIRQLRDESFIEMRS